MRWLSAVVCVGAVLVAAGDNQQDDDNITWLNIIEFPTPFSRNIDVSLSKTAYPEDCYIRKPDGSNLSTTDANSDDGVTVHGSSDYVSCRITIGPMNDALLGDWALCGKRTDNNEKLDRCQLVRITWQNINQDDIINQAKFDHVVNFGGTLTPVVLGNNNRITCHMITNKGEDLVINTDSEYPNLRLTTSESHTCSIAIGPITESMLGNWTLYGRFRDFIGFREVRQPMNLFLYDVNNPYDQAYNVTQKDPVKRIVHLETTVSMEVTNTGKVDSCQGTTPSGVTLDLDSPSYDGASFVNVEESTACRITIDRLTKSHLGNWTVIGKFSSNGRFTEQRQTIELLEEDPENPLIDEDRVVQTMLEQRVTTEIGKSQRIIIHQGLFTEGQSCHIMTPAGLQYTLIDGFNVEGVDIIKENGVECGVLVHVLSANSVGTWTLIARATQFSQLIERRLPFTIVVEGGEDQIDANNITWLNTIEFPTQFNRNIDVSLSKTAYPEDCYIRKPDGSNLSTTDANSDDGVTVHGSSDYVSCRITIGPMNDALLGDWALCGKRTDNNEKPDRCQLVKITWQNINQDDIINQAKFDHVVNFGGTLTPVVLGNNNRITCHMITNNGEDLVINTDSEYPNLHLTTSESHTCSIAIGPITESMLGNWTLYGRFRDFIGFREVRQPMNLFLYDVNNPYDQAYNVTQKDPVKRIVHLETTVSMEVTNTGKVDSCQGTTPSGVTLDLDSPSYDGASFVNVEESTACRITINRLTKSHFGNWTVIGKFSSNGLFTEQRQTIELLEEDPENPLIDEDREVQTMTEQRVTTNIGQWQRIIINQGVFIEGESCHIMTPTGLQYALIDGFNVEGVDIIKENAVECGVLVHVLSEDSVGTWTLIARATQIQTHLIERRLPFTIVVEEYVDALPKEVLILEGNDLHVRLAQSTSRFETCRLEGPPGPGSVSSYVVDPLHVQSCGYIIPNIRSTDAGVWEIIYENKITYRAEIVVNVTNGNEDWATTVNLKIDHAVNRIVGPESAVYCHLEDPQGVTVFDGFGMCYLALDRVTSRHRGSWKMVVATAGKVVADEHYLFVDLHEEEGKPQVVTRVEQDKPIVTMTCSVATNAAVQACKFRNPQGKLLLATPGITEGRYAFHGSESSIQSGVMTYECGLQITDPETTDLGIWRCAIDTEEETHYGFVTVLCPWALSDPTVAATVQQEPILAAATSSLSALDDEPVTMSCTIEANIKYCYFRASNGTTFTVYPGMTNSEMEYVGAGLDAGECGIRFNSLKRGDRGQWSCHVGLALDQTEQIQEFNVNIQNAMTVFRGTLFQANNNAIMFVEGRVDDSRTLEYCRFVRIDGVGFTTANVPEGYTGILRSSSCDLNIANPTMLDRHPWTVVAKAQGLGREFSMVSSDSLPTDLPTTPTPDQLEQLPGGRPGHSSLTLFLIVVLSILLFFIVMVALLGPKKNRRWAFSRASAFRSSLQSSIRKQPLPPQAPISQMEAPVRQIENPA